MNKNLRKMVTAALFAAMIFVLTYFVKVPIAASGYVHFGDALIYICAGVLGGPWAILAGAIGEGLADLIGGYAIYAPATIIIKALIAVPFILTATKKEKFLTPITALMTIPSGIITVGGYYIADLIIDKNYAIVDIPGNVIQAVGSAVLFIVIAAAFDAAKLKSKIKLN
ncbi:MAG: TIGR04002 family protein [Eubacterium sp.]